jgi:general secretion pathway protein D
MAPPQGGSQGTASFGFDPSSVTEKPGSTFAMNVLLSGAQNVSSVPLQVSYNPQILQLVNVSNGGFLSQDGQAVALVHRDDDQSGTVQINATRPPGTAGVSGEGTVVTLTFLAKAAGQSEITIAKGGARDAALQFMPATGAVANIKVQ